MKSFCWMLISVTIFFSPQVANAQGASATDIINALDPQTKKIPATRSFKRGIQIQQGTENQTPPTINLYINFDFDSAQLTNDGQISLENLGKALIDPRLEKHHFLIAGHTDAKGKDDYNQHLSEERAQSVIDYLLSQFHIDGSRLASKGFGSSQLLDSAHPEDGINRRVQITTINE